MIEVNPAFQPYGSLYQQGDRYPDCAAGYQESSWVTKIKDLGYTAGTSAGGRLLSLVKMPVFSFEKIRGADISLGTGDEIHR